MKNFADLVEGAQKSRRSRRMTQVVSLTEIENLADQLDQTVTVPGLVDARKALIDALLVLLSESLEAREEAETDDRIRVVLPKGATVSFTHHPDGELVTMRRDAWEPVTDELHDLRAVKDERDKTREWAVMYPSTGDKLRVPNDIAAYATVELNPGLTAVYRDMTDWITV